MKFFKIALILFVAFILTSCVTTKDVRYFQPSESLVISEEGLVPYNIPEYRISKNDILILNIVTTPKGDAAQFYSSLYAAGSSGSGGGSSVSVSGGGGNGGNANIYFNGLKVASDGEINIFGIGYIKAEGRTIKEVSDEIQTRVNENFLDGKSQVRLDIDGINYTIVSDVETVGMTGLKVAHKNTLTLTEALAENGGLNRTVDRTNIVVHRKFPEGIKIAKIDLTREDAMNSPYYWVQNGDEIYLNTRSKNLNGFGKDPIQTLSTGVSVITTALSIYLILSRL
ncbi:MAG: polysaccharide biosynthesis/export family protein [Chryseobacterium sp.]|nr:polysaccharide biosynthesis/export family protein [Chryseobacterium sp.]